METPVPLEKLEGELQEISGQLYVAEVGVEYLQTEGVKLGLLAVPEIALRLLRLRTQTKALRSVIDGVERLIAEASCHEQKN